MSESARGANVTIAHPTPATALPAPTLPAGSSSPAAASTSTQGISVTESHTPIKGTRKRGFRKHKPPRDSRVYKAVLATLALRAQGCKYEEISETLGLTKNTLVTYLKRANSRGWINLGSFDDPEDKLEHVLKHKVLDNINSVLGEKAFFIDKETGAEIEQDRLSDRAVDVTMEVAKGTGLLKQHQVVKQDGPMNVGLALSVKVEMPAAPASASPIQIRQGAIGGTPLFDGEIVEAVQE